MSNKTQKPQLNIADVISSIELLKNDMESWKETLVENAKDNEKYSEGLLKGYNAAIGQFQNRLGKYCL
jgi:hypothetical protein